MLGEPPESARAPARRRAGRPPRDLLDARRRRAAITEAGLRNDVNVGIQYISSWLRGNGAAAIYGLMEDAATAEIARSQVWQWIRHGVTLEDGTAITRELVERDRGRGARAHPQRDRRRRVVHDGGPPRPLAAPLRAVALGDDFLPFLTLPAYEELEG